MDTTPPQPNHNVTHTSNQSNTTHEIINKSQAPEDGCINIRNMLSIKWWNNKASYIKLVSLYSTIKMMHGPINMETIIRILPPKLVSFIWSSPVGVANTIYTNIHNHNQLTCIFFISFVGNVIQKFINGVISYQFLPSAFLIEKYSVFAVT